MNTYKTLPNYIARWKKMQEMGCRTKIIEADIDEILSDVKTDLIRELDLYGF